MPRVTIWVSDKNYPTWQNIPNKSGWINLLLEDNVPHTQDWVEQAHDDRGPGFTHHPDDECVKRRIMDL